MCRNVRIDPSMHVALPSIRGDVTPSPHTVSRKAGLSCHASRIREEETRFHRTDT